MDEVIWKEKLSIVDTQTILLPEGSTPLCVGDQDGELCLWFMFDFENRNNLVPSEFEIIGTGETIIDISDNQYRQFIGTAIMESCVCHVFERINR